VFSIDRIEKRMEGTKAMNMHTIGTTANPEASIEGHRVVSRDQWVAERKALLAREKELTRLRDQIARERRALPWVRIDKDYVFDGREGRRTLAELFDGRRQLLVQHFMLGPGWERRSADRTPPCGRSTATGASR
jgi:predicted dithiol-disulfide oxidoreductase (DUF899 family)